MKIQLLALPLVALLPVGAQAQNQTPAQAPKAMASVPMDAEAKALLERAIQSYKGASGASYSVTNLTNGKEAGSTLVRYSRPDKLSVTHQRTQGQSVKILLDGSNMYLVQGTSYRKGPAMPGMITAMMGAGGTSSQLIGSLMDGKNPFQVMQGTYSGAPFKNFKGTGVVSLGSRVVDGDVLSGVQDTFTFGLPAPGGATQPINYQVTAWFGGSPLLLRRVQARITQNGKVNTVSEKIVDQQLSPTFDEDTFKFNDAGLKPVAEGGDNEVYWDPQLKVGTDPFNFNVKSLDGKTFSLANYKGKVLVMDFWATWCGPCVASLPELKSAYAKYHSQGMEVVGISLDEDKNALTSFIKSNKMAWPQIYDGKGWNSHVPGVYGVKAIPFMLIIGKDGKIASVNPRGKIDAAVKAALAAS